MGGLDKLDSTGFEAEVGRPQNFSEKKKRTKNEFGGGSCEFYYLSIMIKKAIKHYSPDI